MSARRERVALVIVAAGDGSRLGAATPKAFVRVGGRTLLDHALEAASASRSDEVIVVAPAAWIDEAAREGVSVVEGGPSRRASVAAGLAASTADVILVHDAARAFAPASLIDSVADTVIATASSVIPVLPIDDTLALVDEDEVTGSVDRSSVAAVQTPQGFPAEVLRASVLLDGFTDDASAVRSLGHEVRIIPGSPRAFKITRPADLERAERMLTPPGPRIGLGSDVHGFGNEPPLRLGLLTWPECPGLRGHSDGDAIAHAVVDAVLSAAGLGDIGAQFGTDRPAFAGADGEVFLSETVRLVHGAGMRIDHVAVNVQAARPRLAPRRTEMERALSTALAGARVAITATTTDGLGYIGRGEGVSVTALAHVVLR